MATVLKTKSNIKLDLEKFLTDKFLSRYEFAKSVGVHFVSIYTFTGMVQLKTYRKFLAVFPDIAKYVILENQSTKNNGATK